MPDKTNEHSDQLIGLTDLMVETMEATIDADRRTAEEYYRILEENSFVQSTDGQSSELQMVNVRITNPSGQTQIVSIPKMILMPVPMLHISEATFEIEGNMCLNTTEDTSSGRTVPQRVTTPKKVYPWKNSRQTPPLSDGISLCVLPMPAKEQLKTPSHPPI